MPIKPLERKKNWPVLIKLILLVGLVLSAFVISAVLGKTQEIKIQTQKKLINKIQKSDFINNSIKKAREIGGVVLGEATDTVGKLTSDAGAFISDIIYQNSIGKVANQIYKLPKDQQEKIREQICK